MAMDLAGDDIRCVLVHPGYVQTDMTGENLGNWSRVDVQTNVVVLESMGGGTSACPCTDAHDTAL
jgi:NAD(P)-dependent dehydrogenase (short-subunit alcohol dehydrogenase family)